MYMVMKKPVVRSKNVGKNKLTKPKNDGKDEWARFEGENF